ncbi:MAG: hypothetical protein HZA50_17720 [Planctomycetes bacterium]|nr:hypothetical protein [Planctomycetota bacterium]
MSTGKSTFLAAVVAFACGCEGPSKVYDLDALVSAKTAVVMPATGSPNAAGANAGKAQTGLLINALACLNRYTVQGPAQFARLIRQQADDDAWDPKVQQEALKKLSADLIVLAEVTDHRPSSVSKSSNYYFGSKQWTQSVFDVSVTVRVIRAADGKMLYVGNGWATSQESYSQAFVAATDAAMDELRSALASRPVRKE